MGVHKLWDILEPTKQELPLEHLANKRLCIDLSYWVVQLARVNGGNVKDKPHLRGLFHRIRALVALNCQLIFVADGTVPALKLAVYNRRLQSSGNGLHTREQYGLPRKEKLGPVKRNRGSEFGRMIEEAKALGLAMGIPCVTSLEEAEAQCATFNAMGLCDGCLTADSDAFLFGAKTVYKEIILGNSGDGHVIMYTMERITRELGYGRNSLISLALLLGCDYFPGLHGLGPEKAKYIVQKFGEGFLEMVADGKIEVSVKCLSKYIKGLGKDHDDKENVNADAKSMVRDKQVVHEAILGYKNPKCHSATSYPAQMMLMEIPVRLEELRSICRREFDWPQEKTDDYILPKLAERDIRRFLATKAVSEPVPTQYKLSEIVKVRTLHNIEHYEVNWTGQPEIKSSIIRADIVNRAYPGKVDEFRRKKAAKSKQKRKTKQLIPAEFIETINSTLHDNELVRKMDNLSLCHISELDGHNETITGGQYQRSYDSLTNQAGKRLEPKNDLHNSNGFKDSFRKSILMDCSMVLSVPSRNYDRTAIKDQSCPSLRPIVCGSMNIHVPGDVEVVDLTTPSPQQRRERTGHRQKIGNGIVMIDLSPDIEDDHNVRVRDLKAFIEDVKSDLHVRLL